MKVKTGRLIEIYMGSFRNLEMYDAKDDSLEPAVKDELEKLQAILENGIEFQTEGINKKAAEIQYEDAAAAINMLKTALNAHEGFGRERGGGGLTGILGGIKDICGRRFSLWEKAAKLFYEVLKQHPFEDGNKRIGSFLFVYLLNINDCLYKENGDLRIDSNTLAALAILIAKSEPFKKQEMPEKVKGLTAQLINDENGLLD